MSVYMANGSREGPYISSNPEGGSSYLNNHNPVNSRAQPRDDEKSQLIQMLKKINLNELPASEQERLKQLSDQY